MLEPKLVWNNFRSTLKERNPDLAEWIKDAGLTEAKVIPHLYREYKEGEANNPIRHPTPLFLPHFLFLQARMALMIPLSHLW